MIERFDIAPEKPDWYNVGGQLRLTTSSDIHRAMQEHSIDDSAAREWMRNGARLTVNGREIGPTPFNDPFGDN